MEKGSDRERQEARLSALVESDLVGLIWLDGERIVDANRAFFALVERTRDELASGLSLSELTPREHRAASERALAELSRTGRLPQIETELLRTGGTRVPVLLGGVATGSGETVAFVFDLAERKRAEEARLRSEERYRLVAESIRAVIWEWDLRTDRVEWGEGAAEALGFARGLGGDARFFSDRIHPDDRERVSEGIYAIAGGPASPGRSARWTDEYRFLRGDGRIAIVVGTAQVVRSKLGEPLRVVGAIVDVTERREAARRSERDQLEERRRILVVDDEPLVRSALRRALGRRHEVSVASSGTEALARISAGERFDLILCDLWMPQMTGMELHAELTRADAAQADRMAFLTGGAFADEARAFLEGGGHRRLDKPFEVNALTAFVAEALGD